MGIFDLMEGGIELFSLRRSGNCAAENFFSAHSMAGGEFIRPIVDLLAGVQLGTFERDSNVQALRFRVGDNWGETRRIILFRGV